MMWNLTRSLWKHSLVLRTVTSREGRVQCFFHLTPQNMDSQWKTARGNILHPSDFPLADEIGTKLCRQVITWPAIEQKQIWTPPSPCGARSPSWPSPSHELTAHLASLTREFPAPEEGETTEQRTFFDLTLLHREGALCCSAANTDVGTSTSGNELVRMFSHTNILLD